MKGLWGRHLVVFVGLFSVLVADKEFWWMGQEGTFGQGSNQVRNYENPIFQTVHDATPFRVKRSNRGLVHHQITRVGKVGSNDLISFNGHHARLLAGSENLFNPCSTLLTIMWNLSC